MRIALVNLHWGDYSITCSDINEEEVAKEITSRGSPSLVQIRMIQQYPEPLELLQATTYYPRSTP